jgi:hypothetical protein
MLHLACCMLHAACCTRQVVDHFEACLEEWIAQTENLLQDGLSQQLKVADVGPASELEFWRKRMGKLNSLSEQLKNKHCKVTYHAWHSGYTGYSRYQSS